MLNFYRIWNKPWFSLFFLTFFFCIFFPQGWYIPDYNVITGYSSRRTSDVLRTGDVWPSVLRQIPLSLQKLALNQHFSASYQAPSEQLSGVTDYIDYRGQHWSLGYTSHSIGGSTRCRLKLGIKINIVTYFTTFTCRVW